MTCTHNNLVKTTGWHIFQKGKREYVKLYGIQCTCKDCGLEGTIQNEGFIILPVPTSEIKSKRKKK